MKVRDRLRILSYHLQGLFFQYLGRDYQCGCGHKAKWKTLVVPAPGMGGIYTLNKPDYCPNCCMKQVIKCAWCGEVILPGDPITLYTPRPDFVIPDHAKSVCDLGGHQVRLVGCPRPSCADTGADYAGTWEMPGKVVTRQTAYEMIIGEKVTVQK